MYVILAMGCGRVGFDASSGRGDGGSSSDAGTFDPVVWPPLEASASVYLGSDTSSPHVAWNGEAFAVVWDSPTGWLYATYATDGTPLEPARPSVLGLVWWSLASPMGVLVLHSRGSSELWLAHVERNGAISSDVRIGTGHSGHLAFNSDGARLCISWIDSSSSPNRTRAVATDLLGNKLGADLVAQVSGTPEFKTAVGCDGDRVRVLWTADDGTSSGMYYRSYDAESPVIAETRLATLPAGNVQLQGAVLGAPELTEAYVLYRIVGASAWSVRLGTLGLDGMGTVAADEAIANSQLAVMQWEADGRFLIGFERLDGGLWNPYLAMLAPDGAVVAGPTALGSDLSPIIGDGMPSSIARSPGGTIAVGAERFGTADFSVDSFVAFLVPE